MEEDKHLKFKGIALKRKTTMSEMTKKFIDDLIEEDKNPVQPQISIISYNIQQPPQQPQQEQENSDHQPVVDIILKLVKELNVNDLNEVQVNTLEAALLAKTGQLKHRFHDIRRSKILRRNVNEQPQTIVKEEE